MPSAAFQNTIPPFEELQPTS